MSDRHVEVAASAEPLGRSVMEPGNEVRLDALQLAEKGLPQEMVNTEAVSTWIRLDHELDVLLQPRELRE